jgi:hypothetical protein
MRKIVKQDIDRKIEALAANGFPASAIILSRDKYTEFLKELAYDRATDNVEPIGIYQEILVVVAPGENIVSVVPNAEIHWNNASEIDELSGPEERKTVVRFTEI